MNRLMRGAAVLPLLAWGAVAQDSQSEITARVKKLAQEEMQLQMNMVGSVKGAVVKGMPYSADEITETDHVLADGTRIHRETKVAVYRDSEGRTRRETPESVTINDPVAGTTFVVNTKNNTVKALRTSNNFIYRGEGTGLGAGSGSGENVTFSIRTNGGGPSEFRINDKPMDPKMVEEMIAKAKAEGRPVNLGLAKVRVPKGEPLGKRNIEGVIADGTRHTETIETGAIGNDRPIQVSNERWYSEELGMTVMTRHSDPRMGDETFRVTNIRRGDPPAYLFQAPADPHSEKKM